MWPANSECAWSVSLFFFFLPSGFTPSHHAQSFIQERFISQSPWWRTPPEVSVAFHVIPFWAWPHCIITNTEHFILKLYSLMSIFTRARACVCVVCVRVCVRACVRACVCVCVCVCARVCDLQLVPHIMVSAPHGSVGNLPVIKYSALPESKFFIACVSTFPYIIIAMCPLSTQYTENGRITMIEVSLPQNRYLAPRRLFISIHAGRPALNRGRR